ncbi:MAG: CDP-alcohol phosphatidyltransferase family protein [Prevotella sp.]|nr:CDP-alcohol phosphatidyltransferase family protein [Prevotella sp.]
MEKRSFNELLRASFKSDDTEEWLDVHFTRPIGLAFALMWEKLGVHPNAITILSIFLGVGAGVMFYYPDFQHNLLGVILLMFANFCDSTDGQLARLTGQKTLIGRMLDGFSGDLWFFAIYVAIACRLINEPVPFLGGQTWGIGIFIICIVAGFLCHSPQSSLADYYRQIHLFFLLGKNGSELDDYKSQRAVYESLPWKGNFWAKMFYYNYANYCHSQEKRTPAFQALYQIVRQRWRNVDDMPQTIRDEFRHNSLPLMKYTNMLTFNSRAILIYVTCLAGVPYVYPLVEMTVFVAMYVYMHKTHEQFCVRMAEKL